MVYMNYILGEHNQDEGENGIKNNPSLFTNTFDQI